MENKKNKISPNWISGFTDGEGTFSIFISSAKDRVNKKQVQLQYCITQGIKNKDILYEIQDFFNCGYIALSNKAGIDKRGLNGKERYQFRVRSIGDIINIIIPHFDKYPLHTEKLLDYQDWKKVAYMVNKDEHLTLEGLKKIEQIKLNMNHNRKKS